MEKLFSFDVVVNIDSESKKDEPTELKEKEVIIDIEYPNGYETNFSTCDFEEIRKSIFEVLV